MKPSEQIQKIFEQRISDLHHPTELGLLKNWISSIEHFLDQTFEKREGFTTKDTNLTDLLKEIEGQKQEAFSSGYKSGQRRLRDSFDQLIQGQHNPAMVGVEWIRKELFEKEGVTYGEFKN